MEGNKIKEVFNYIYRTIVVILSIIILFNTLLLVYLNFSQFKINYNKETVQQFIDKSYLNDKLEIYDNEIKVSIPNNVLNTEILSKLEEINSSKHIKIQDIQLDNKTEKININYIIFGFKIPLSYSVDLNYSNDKKIKFTVKEVLFGRKNLKVPILSSYLKDKIIDINNLIVDMNILNGTAFKGKTILLEDQYYLVYEVDNNVLKNLLYNISLDTDRELVYAFKTSGIKSRQQAVEYIENINNYTQNEMNIIFKELINNYEVFENILILSKENNLDAISKEYGNLLNINYDEIISKKGGVLSAILYDYYEKIIKNLKTQYFENETMYINRGNPYSFSRQLDITPRIINNEQELNIPIETINKLQFCYDKKTNKILISYKLEDDYYLLINEDNQIGMDNIEFQNKYGYEDTGTPGYVKDKDTWEAIVNKVLNYFDADDIFIRWMKADTKYSFVIASPKSDYQSYSILILEQDNNEWIIIEDKLKTIESIQEKYPSLNLKLTTNEIETVSFHYLSDEMQKVILEDLYNKEIINDLYNVNIEYCSYGNNYIAILLSDGREFIYKVKSMYLHSVYTKDEAYNSISEVPYIISLQDAP